MNQYYKEVSIFTKLFERKEHLIHLGIPSGWSKVYTLLMNELNELN